MNLQLSYTYFIKEFSKTAKELLERKTLLEKAKKNKHRAKLDGVSELYSKFLYFQYFIALEKPLILCEGKTDITYLKTAIKQLAKKNIYKFPHDINFFSHTDRTSKVIQIHGGTPALKNFIEFYEKQTKFTFLNKKHPVIVILDNDCTAKDVVNFIMGSYKQESVTYDRCKTFSYYVTSNLYVILLPIASTQSICSSGCNKKNKVNRMIVSVTKLKIYLILYILLKYLMAKLFQLKMERNLIRINTIQKLHLQK